MTDKVREHKCPNCGAPLGIPHKHDRYFKCQFCGTVLEDNATPEEQETGMFNIKITSEDIARARSMASIPVYTAYTSPVMVSTPEELAKASRRAGCIITAVVLVFTLATLAAVLIPILASTGALIAIGEYIGVDLSDFGGSDDGGSPGIGFGDDSGLGGLDVYSFGPVGLLDSDNDTTPDVVTVASLSDSTDQLMYIDFENTPNLRWKAQAGEGASYVYNQFVASDALLYFSYGSKLTAYNRLNGAVAWEINLADEIQFSICEECLTLLGDAVVVLTADGSLTAYDAASGAQRWSVRNHESPRQIINSGGNPAVLDQQSGNDPYIQVFDLATGSPLRQIFSTCPNRVFTNDTNPLMLYDYVPVAADGSSIYVIGSLYSPGCVEKWDGVTGALVWQAASLPEDALRDKYRENLLFTDTNLFIANSYGVFSVSLADGAAAQLVANEDYDFEPLGARDGVLALIATRTRGTSRTEIWGVDAALGNVKWTFIPQDADRMDLISTAISSGAEWTAGLTSAGLTVALFMAEPQQLILQTIPLQSGTASPPLTVPIASSLGAYWVELVGFRGSEFWLAADATVRVINVDSGQVQHAWP